LSWCKPHRLQNRVSRRDVLAADDSMFEWKRALSIFDGGSLADAGRGRKGDDPAFCPGARREGRKMLDHGAHINAWDFSAINGHSLFSLPSPAPQCGSVHLAFGLASGISGA